MAMLLDGKVFHLWSAVAFSAGCNWHIRQNSGDSVASCKGQILYSDTCTTNAWNHVATGPSVHGWDVNSILVT